jgi:KinB signaling pathway activation protein
MWTTTVIGLVSTLVLTGIFMVADGFFTDNLTQGKFVFNLITTSQAGMTYGVFAMMGFFAYLMVNYIALSIFRQPTIWRGLQIVLTIVTLVDLAVLPVYLLKDHHAWYLYLILPVVLLTATHFVAKRKARETNQAAYVPAMFFLVVITTIEAWPALKQDEFKAIAWMIIPLFLCNAWQIMQLHKLLRR